MPQFRDIPVAPDAKYVRVQLAERHVDALARLGAKELISVAAVARIALSLLAEERPVTAEDVLAEVRQIRKASRKEPEPEPVAKRPRGRPRKTS